MNSEYGRYVMEVARSVAPRQPLTRRPRASGVERRRSPGPRDELITRVRFVRISRVQREVHG